MNWQLWFLGGIDMFRRSSMVFLDWMNAGGIKVDMSILGTTET